MFVFSLLGNYQHHSLCYLGKMMQNASHSVSLGQATASASAQRERPSTAFNFELRVGIFPELLVAGS
jgi:hypothetical protein